MAQLGPISDPNSAIVPTGDGSLNPSNWIAFQFINPATGQPSTGGTFAQIGMPQPILGSSGDPLAGGSGNPVLPNLGSSGDPLASLQGSTLSYGATPQQQATSAATQAVTGSAGPATGSLADYFARTIIVILGFIFVAVGLHMLMPSTVPDVRNVVRR